MTKIRCPHCGSPVRIRGQRWECTWCGDFGSLASLTPAQKAKLVQAIQMQQADQRIQASDRCTPEYSQDDQQPAPDYTALEDAVRRWDFSRYEWACRDLLLTAFPNAASRFTPAQRAEMDTMDLLLGVADTDPDTAIAMMELLLNTAEEHLQQKDVARQLLDWDCFDLLLREEIQTRLVEELEWNHRLARQLFQSAYVDLPQEELTQTCGRLGKQELQQKLLALLAQNPYPHEPIHLD